MGDIFVTMALAKPTSTVLGSEFILAIPLTQGLRHLPLCSLPAAHPSAPPAVAEWTLAELSWLRGRTWAVWAASTKGPHFYFHVP